MKKTLFTVCSLIWLLATDASAQSAVRLKPLTSNGFLLLNTTDFPNVTNWEVKLLKNTYTNGSVTTTEESRELLQSKSYTHFDPEYYAPAASNVDYSYSVTGYDATNTPITSFGPERLCTGCLPPYFEEVKTWKCEGKRYAWTVKLWHNTATQGPDAGHYFLIFDQAADHFSNENSGYLIPFYEWAPLEWKDNICATPSLLEYYGLTTNDCYSIGANGTSEKIISRSATTSDLLRDMNCAAIAGSIFGIQKYLGDWRGRGGMMIDIASSNLAGYSRTELIGKINDEDWFDFTEPLECEACSESGPSWNEGGWGELTAGIVIACDELTTDDNMEYNGTGCDIWDIIGIMSGNVGGVRIKITDDVTWRSNLKAVHISRVDQSGTNLRINRDDLFSKSGKFTYTSLEFEPGLYLAQYIHDDQTILPVYYEVKEQQTFEVKNKDQLNVTIYPVPIIGNSFDMELKAAAKMSFNYKLYGPSMNILQTFNLDMSKGETLTTTVESSVVSTAVWPSGIYTNVFTFNDGSVKTITTVKP